MRDLGDGSEAREASERLQNEMVGLVGDPDVQEAVGVVKARA